MKAQRQIDRTAPVTARRARTGPKAASGEASQPSPALLLQDQLARSLNPSLEDARWSARRRLVFLLAVAASSWAVVIALAAGAVSLIR